MKKFSASFKLKNATFLSNDSNMDNKKQGIINYIDPSIITYISKVQHEKDRPRKIASIGELDYKDSNINNGLNDNIHVDTDKKSKARRSLLYLLNVMSGGTFCPEINNYFNELREMKNKENQDNKENKIDKNKNNIEHDKEKKSENIEDEEDDILHSIDKNFDNIPYYQLFK